MSETSEFLKAMAEIRERLESINDVERVKNLPSLEDKAWSWQERATELAHFVHKLEGWAHRGDVDAMTILLDTVLSHGLAFKIALARVRSEVRDAA